MTGWVTGKPRSNSNFRPCRMSLGSIGRIRANHVGGLLNRAQLPFLVVWWAVHFQLAGL
jgi:hypothetical protein